MASLAPSPRQVPLPEEIQVSPGDTEIHRAEAEEIANHLTAFHWELFRCIHEVRSEGLARRSQACVQGCRAHGGETWGAGGGDREQSMLGKPKTIDKNNPPPHPPAHFALKNFVHGFVGSEPGRCKREQWAGRVNKI